MERIISETLFGTDSDEHIEYLCIAKKEGHYNIWYFSEINGEVHCLACAKRESDLTKKVKVYINTSFERGTEVRVFYGKSLFGIENPVLYFLDGEDSIKKTQTADISFKINEEALTVKINKEIKKLWFGNFKEEQEYVDFKFISNLEEFVKLNEIKFNGFNDVSLSELKTSVPVKLSYSFCDVINNLRQVAL